MLFELKTWVEDMQLVFLVRERNDAWTTTEDELLIIEYCSACTDNMTSIMGDWLYTDYRTIQQLQHAFNMPGLLS